MRASGDLFRNSITDDVSPSSINSSAFFQRQKDEVSWSAHPEQKEPNGFNGLTVLVLLVFSLGEIMKTNAIIFEKTGGPEILKYVPIQVGESQAGEVLIRHHAIGVNFIDTYFRSGLYETQLPSGLGFEAAGVVEKVGAGVSHVRPGDRVAYAQGPLGAYAEHRWIPGNFVVKIPDAVSFEDAASVMLKGLTVSYLFQDIFPVKKNDLFLFHAAAGGTGMIACQWARHLWHILLFPLN